MAIGDAIEHWARYIPQQIAIQIGDRNNTYKALYDRALSIGTTIIDSAINGRVAIGVTDKFEYLACLIGLNLARISVVVVNPYANIESIKVHLKDTKPAAIIGDSEFLKSIEREYSDNLIFINIFNVQMINNIKLPSTSTNSEWGVLFSSGSTGTSKAIVYDHLAMSSELIAWCLELGIRRESKFYIGRPIHYTGGLVLSLATLLVGGEVILPDSGDDSDFMSIWIHYQNTIKNRTVDYAFFVPDQIRLFIKIAKDPLGGPTILTMGAPISGDEKKRAYDQLKSPLIESWGNSEGLGTITDKNDLFTRPDSIGRPFLTEKIYVVTDEFDICKPRESGRLAGSDETMFTEYANHPDATNRVKKKNLVLSDDLGYMDENHYFYILGRDQESFVIDGQIIFLTDLEEQIRKLSGICDVCIVSIGKTDPIKFYALIVSDESFSKDLIKQAIQKSLSIKFSDILFLKTLPRLSSGKIDRLAASKSIK